MKHFTYRNMVSSQKKTEMQSEKVCKLGSQDGGFGIFHAHFTCISEIGVEELRKEVDIVAEMLGKTSEELIQEMPVLLEVFGYAHKD